MYRVAFSVDDITEALAIAARHGCHPLRGVATYGDRYKLIYLRVGRVTRTQRLSGLGVRLDGADALARHGDRELPPLLGSCGDQRVARNELHDSNLPRPPLLHGRPRR